MRRFNIEAEKKKVDVLIRSLESEKDVRFFLDYLVERPPYSDLIKKINTSMLDIS